MIEYIKNNKAKKEWLIKQIREQEHKLRCDKEALREIEEQEQQYKHVTIKIKIKNKKARY